MHTPILLVDYYKLGHRPQYPPGTEYVYSTWTGRKSLVPGINYTVAFGLQHFIKKYLIDGFNDNFFHRPLSEVIDEYERIVMNTLGIQPDHEHLIDLWNLGYLPLKIKALPEGTIVPIGVPWITIENTHPKFFWLTNYIESLMSAELWQATTSATIANEFYKTFSTWAKKTNPEQLGFVDFQGHDFAFRGMSSVESAALSGMGHLLSFKGTDTITGIMEAEDYYGANVEKELIGTSVPATEHSVMCAGGPGAGELETYRRLITDVYPKGIVSIVSDTWDLWHVITQTLGRDLHDVIMERDGKVVVRPDSGDPVDIMCGTDYEPDFHRYGCPGGTPEQKGVIELLWDFFGGTISSTGYKVLDPHIGAIYGDGETLERVDETCSRLERKGFASTNWVAGIGSFTYQRQTRDSFGHAMKATDVVINGEEIAIFKDPVTDTSKMKKSQTGRVAVLEHDGSYKFLDRLNRSGFHPHGGFISKDADCLQTVFLNGAPTKFQTFSEIRARLASERSLSTAG